MNTDNKTAFVNNGFKALKNTFIFQMLFIVWIFSLPSLLIGLKIVWIKIILLGLGGAYTIFGIVLMFFKKTKAMKFLFDGISSIYISFILVMLAYKIFTYLYGRENWIIILLSLLLWLIIIFFYNILARHLVRKNFYMKQKAATGIVAGSLSGAGIGYFFARRYLNNLDDYSSAIVILILVIFLSLIFAMGSANYLKFYYYKKYGDGQ